MDNGLKVDATTAIKKARRPARIVDDRVRVTDDYSDNSSAHEAFSEKYLYRNLESYTPLSIYTQTKDDSCSRDSVIGMVHQYIDGGYVSTLVKEDDVGPVNFESPVFGSSKTAYLGARLRKFFGNSNVVYKFYKDKEDNTLKDNKRNLQVSVYAAMAASEFNKNVPARDKIHFVDGVILELLPEAIKLLNKGSDSPLNIMMAKSLFWYVEREVEGPGKFETIVCNTGYIKKDKDYKLYN